MEDEQLEGQGASEEGRNNVPLPLGPFMTPQPSAVRSSSVLSNQSGFSLQGPQRIRVMHPWKVKDIVVPPPSTPGVKKEDPEPKGHVSEAEKSVRNFVVLHFSSSIDFLLHQQAIRARRKSALTMPDPADSLIPGSRRMSTIQRDRPTAPSVPPSSKKPFIKSDPNPPEEEEGTDVLLEKVKAKIEDLKRRQSIGLGPPPLERQRSRSPTKQDAEALFWGSDSVTSTRIDRMGDKSNGGMDPPHPRDEDEDMDEEEVEEQEVIQQTTPVKHRNPTGKKLPPKTPRMDGVKGLFANPKAVPPTPVMGGIKQLFNGPVEPQTPAYGGVREMFRPNVAPAAPETPVLEGVRDLLNTPVAYRQPPPPPGPAELSVETAMADLEAVIPETRASEAARRRKVAAGAKQPIEEPVLLTTDTTQPLKIGRPRKALKVSYLYDPSFFPDVDESFQEEASLAKPAQTRKVAGEAVSSSGLNVLNIVLTWFHGFVGAQKTYSQLRTRSKNANRHSRGRGGGAIPTITNHRQYWK